MVANGPLERPRRRWVDNIRMDLQEVGYGYMDWTGLAQDRDTWRTLVSSVMNLRVPWNAWNFLTTCKPVSCSRRTVHHGISKWAQPPKHEPHKFSAHRQTHTHNSCNINLVLYSHTDYLPFSGGLSSPQPHYKPLSNLPLSCNALDQIGPKSPQCRGF